MSKIAVLGPVPPYRGGIAHYNRALISEFNSAGNPPLIISYKRMYPKFLYPGKSDKEPDAGSSGYPKEAYCLDSLNPLTWVRTLYKIRKSGVRLVVMHWWTYFWAMLTSFLCIGLRIRKHRPRILFICHNIYDHEKNLFKNILTRFTLRLADGFLVHSRKHQEQLRSLYPAKDVFFHPMPVFSIFPEPGEEKPRSILNLQEKDSIALFFGFIRRYKGLDILIKAIPLIAEKIPSFHLLVAGEAMFDLKREYEQLVESLGVHDRVSFHWSYIPMNESWLYFKAADVLVLPYKKASGSALLTLGLYYELPVIATRTGNFEEIIVHDKSGYLAEPENIQSLAQFVIKYFTGQKKKSFVQSIREQKSTGSWKELGSMITSYGEQVER